MSFENIFWLLHLLSKAPSKKRIEKQKKFFFETLEKLMSKNSLSFKRDDNLEYCVFELKPKFTLKKLIVKYEGRGDNPKYPSKWVAVLEGHFNFRKNYLLILDKKRLGMIKKAYKPLNKVKVGFSNLDSRVDVFTNDVKLTKNIFADPYIRKFYGSIGLLNELKLMENDSKITAEVDSNPYDAYNTFLLMNRIVKLVKHKAFTAAIDRKIETPKEVDKSFSMQIRNIEPYVKKITFHPDKSNFNEIVMVGFSFSGLDFIKYSLGKRKIIVTANGRIKTNTSVVMSISKSGNVKSKIPTYSELRKIFNVYTSKKILRDEILKDYDLLRHLSEIENLQNVSIKINKGMLSIEIVCSNAQKNVLHSFYAIKQIISVLKIALI